MTAILVLGGSHPPPVRSGTLSFETLRTLTVATTPSRWYKVTFESPEHRRYTIKVPLGQWQRLAVGTEYQIGRNLFGAIRTRTIKAAKAVSEVEEDAAS
jgi:hypothetical protein